MLDGDYRLKSQQAGPVQSLDFTYDAADAGRSQTFAYDAADRLVSADGVYGTRDYGYDALGNRLSRTANGQADSYAYEVDSNRLDSVSGANAEAFSYDAVGNTVAKGPLAFGYNDANRLSSVSASGQSVASYVYNARGERVSKTIGGETRLFHYDLGGNLLGEIEAGAALRAYVYVDGERVALLAVEPPSVGVFFYHNDHLGTPKALTDEAQNLVWAAAHTPFGTALVSVDQVDNPLRFPGQYFDEETGLHYNYFRDYDPETGRYIESDPIGLVGGVNTFVYANVNPLRFTDSQGLLFGDPSDFVLADAVATASGIATSTIAALSAGVTGVALALFPQRLGDDFEDLPTGVVAGPGFKPANETGQCPAPGNGDDDFCTRWRTQLQQLLRLIIIAKNRGLDVSSRIATYNQSARQFNFLCSQGNSTLSSNDFPPLPLF